MAARVLLDDAAQHNELWGDVKVKLVGDDNSTVTASCTVDPAPNVRDLFYNYGAPPVAPGRPAQRFCGFWAARRQRAQPASPKPGRAVRKPPYTRAPGRACPCAC